MTPDERKELARLLKLADAETALAVERVRADVARLSSEVVALRQALLRSGVDVTGVGAVPVTVEIGADWPDGLPLPDAFKP